VKTFVVEHAYRLFDAVLAVGVLVAILNRGTRYWLAECVDDQQSNIYVAASAVSATLLGFMIAAVTILLMLNTGRITRVYKKSGLYAKTLLLFHESAVWLTALTIAALAGLFIDPVHGSEPVREWADAWIWLLCGLAAAALWRFLYCLEVLRQVMKFVAGPTDGRTASRDDIPPPDEQSAPL
jgi:hypothetical protein